MKSHIQLFKYIKILVVLLIPMMAFGQSMASIKGMIQSSDGEALPSVNAFLKNTDKGSSTDVNGMFNIENITPGSYTLEISYIGYEMVSKKLNLTQGQILTVDFSLNSANNVLDEISVKGESLKLENSTITIDVVNIDDIKNLNIEQPLRLIEQVPGVDLVAYRQGGVADQFSIRGFGGGGHGGEAGVEIDGISLNEAEGHSDGYADLNILIPLNLKRLKVYKGPSSVLFGRFAQGGTLSLETRKGGEYQDISLRAGSYNTLDAQYAQGNTILLGKSKKALQTNLAFQFFNSDGYSDNSEVLKGNISGRASYEITDKTDISVSLMGHQSQWNGPGYIPEAQYLIEEKRRQQDVFGENDGGAKQFYSERVDLNHSFSSSLKLLLFGYAVQQDFSRFAKFNYSPGGQSETFNTRDVYATGGSLNGRSTVSKIGIDWLAGLEYYNEKTDRFRWSSTDRIRNNLTEERYFSVQSISAFMQGEFEISQYFRPSLGLRYDTFKGDFEGRDPNVENVNNKIQDLSHISPKLGFRSTLVENFDLRASVSNGFSLPNSSAKYDAVINLDPVELWQYEVGLSYTKVENFTLDVAAFTLNSSKEIVEFPPGSGILLNSGKTQRSGIETKASVNVAKSLVLTGTFSYIETEIKESREDYLVGKGLTGIPKTIATFDVNYTSESGFGSRFRIRDVGPYFVSQTNNASYEGYTVSNLTLFYNFSGYKASTGRIFLEVLNLFDSKYSESVFGDDTSKSFAPAPTRNVMLGINYSF
ncbi:MAG TPA: TonB-dependent receptor [Saprospiraceae bacterium]|nr:TonB-dependent receptor [Saprospiraceae bacterium]HPN68352.1 TonB-dependent receptor [Saprospiraceae bacterium]